MEGSYAGITHPIDSYFIALGNTCLPPGGIKHTLHYTTMNRMSIKSTLLTVAMSALRQDRMPKVRESTLPFHTRYRADKI